MFDFKRVTAATVALSFAFSPMAFGKDLVVHLVETKGKVLINHGGRFVPALDAMALRAGDRILVGQESTATLAYPDCSVTLAAANIFTVPSAKACAPGETASLIDGVFVKPVAATSPAGRLNRMISTYTSKQKMAQQSGDVETAKCLSDKVSRMRNLNSFWKRNPGVDPTKMIGDLDSAASSCHDMQPIQKVEMVEPAQPPQPIVVTEQAAIAPSVVDGGIDGSTLVIAGGGLLLAGGVVALVLLNTKKCSVSVSAC
jgi:hypothetical protein